MSSTRETPESVASHAGGDRTPTGGTDSSASPVRTADAVDAFISYSREDLAFARSLQDALERRSRRLNPRLRQGRRVVRVVRDETDLTATTDLPAAIQAHLARARTLVVVCSPAARRSSWVAREIEFYRDHHGADAPIVTVIAAGGEPLKDTAFPIPLLEGRREPLAVEFRPHAITAMGLDPRDYVADDGALRVLAPILGIEYPTLKDRQGAFERAVLKGRVAMAFGLVLVFAVVAAYAWYQRNQAIDRLAANYWTQASLARREDDWLRAAHLLARAAAVSRDSTVLRDAAMTVGQLAAPVQLRARGTHPSPVAGAARPANGTGLITWSNDGVLQVWESTPAALPTKLGERIAMPGGAAWSLDRRHVSTWSGDGRARVFEPATGRQLGVTVDHGSPLRLAILSPDSRQLLTVGTDRTARLWPVAANGPALSLTHGAEVIGGRWSRDGRFIVTWANDDTLQFWDARTGARLHREWKHAGMVGDVAIDAGGLRLAAWSLFGSVTLWDMSSASALRRPIAELPADGASFSPSGRLLVTWSRGGGARILDSASGRLLCDVPPETAALSASRFDPEEKRVVLWGLTGATLWDVAQCRKSAVFEQGTPVLGARFLRGGALLTWDWNGVLRTWDPSTGGVHAAAEHDSTLQDVLIDAEHELALSWSSRTARVWRLPALEPVGLPVRQGGQLKGVSMNEDATFWTWGDDGLVSLWSVDVVARDYIPLHHDAPVVGAVASSDGHRIASWTADAVTLWSSADDVVEPQRLPPLPGLSGVRFAERGDIVVEWSLPGVVAPWRLDGSRPVADPTVTHADITGVALSPDGETILTWGESSARLWKRTSGELLGAAMAHAGVIHRAAFSPSGRLVVTSSVDGSTRVWDARTGAPVTPPLVQPHPRAAASRAGIMPVQLRLSSSFPPVGPVDALFAAGETRVVTWDRIATAAIWDVGTGRMIGRPIAHPNGVLGALAGPDGQTIVTWGRDGRVQARRAGNGQEVWPPLVHPDVVHGVRWSGASTLLTWSGDNTARVWDAGTGKPRSSPFVHDAAVSGALLNQEGSRVLTWSEDGTARLWRIRDGAAEATLRHGVAVAGAMWTNDESLIVTWDSSSTIRMWFARDGSPAMPPRGDGSALRGALHVSGGDHLLTFGDSSSARLWKLPSQAGSVADLVRRLEIASGGAHDDDRGFVALSADEWRRRRQERPDSAIHP